jgi:hypothetical protein
MIPRLLDRVHHLVERHDTRRHPFGVELDLKLTEIAAEALDSGDARNGQEPIVHVEFREVAQRHQICGPGFGFEGELEDLVQTAGEARDERRIGARWKLAGGLRDALSDELPRAVVISAGIEFNRDLRDTKLRRRSDAAHVR